jgi:hypothetical protein
MLAGPETNHRVAKTDLERGVPPSPVAIYGLVVKCQRVCSVRSVATNTDDP